VKRLLTKSQKLDAVPIILVMIGFLFLILIGESSPVLGIALLITFVSIAYVSASGQEKVEKLRNALEEKTEKKS
jgi:Ca2+/Na+ antiporter